ncbi:hypothetical protein [Paractinoplanes hotanensis]|uniref:Uncharacterized protein n=1 Tax=Paractinoplanes hotanensis TaxID=2906497 RepID=A0ABT0XTY9_9ACTN|nr:hypothetical protein [Actinoplanes hotanensis]MCM4077115.1 hypothetical protein [Actinoplanes hotanensis]
MNELRHFASFIVANATGNKCGKRRNLRPSAIPMQLSDVRPDVAQMTCHLVKRWRSSFRLISGKRSSVTHQSEYYQDRYLSF